MRINLCTKCKFFINPEDPTLRCNNHHDASPTGCAHICGRPFPEVGTHAQEKKKIMSLDWHSDLLASAEALSPVHTTHLYTHTYLYMHI